MSDWDDGSSDDNNEPGADSAWGVCDGAASDWNDNDDGDRGAVSGWDVDDGARSIGGSPANDASVATSANDAAAATAASTAGPNLADGDPDFGGVWHPHGRAKGKIDAVVGVEGAASGGRRYPRPRRPRPDCNVDFGLNRRRGGLEHRAFVSQLPFEVFEEELHEFFETRFGPVKTCQVVRERYGCSI